MLEELSKRDYLKEPLYYYEHYEGNLRPSNPILGWILKCKLEKSKYGGCDSILVKMMGGGESRFYEDINMKMVSRGGTDYLVRNFKDMEHLPIPFTKAPSL